MDLNLVKWLAFVSMFCSSLRSAASAERRPVENYGSGISSDEKRLVKHLLDNYERVGIHGSPIVGSTPITVNISLGLIELRDFDVENQEMTLVGWTAMEWEDSMLAWKPTDFEGVESVNLDLSSGEIWQPDVILTNSLSAPEEIHQTNTHIQHDGRIRSVNTYKYHFFCKVPSDELDSETFDCNMAFGSWSTPDDQMILNNKGARFDTSYYVNNRDWEFFKNKADKSSVELPWGVTSSQVKFSFSLKRRASRDDDSDQTSSAAFVTSSVSSMAMCLYVLMSHL